MKVYTQSYVAKLLDEDPKAVARIAAREMIRPNFGVGVKLLYSEIDKDRLLNAVQKWRASCPKGTYPNQHQKQETTP
jgi:hypothetical protein